MIQVRVFDPAMCCSTGICGPSVDPKLTRFAADLDWLKSQGVSVERYNLAQQPAAFAADAAVKAALEARGEESLPLIAIGGAVKSSGTYPTREELATWAGVGVAKPSLYTEQVAELVAIGAAIASNCEPCFKYHQDKARKLGVSREDMLRAVSTAQNVKDTPARAMLELAQRYLSRDAEPIGATGDAQPATPKAGGCCGPAGKAEPSAASAEAQPAKAKASGCCAPKGDAEPKAKKSGCC